MPKIPKPPQQPVVLPPSGAADMHFLPNLLVVYIAQHGHIDVRRILNDDGRFSDDDARQMQQLLGIKIAAYERLPYVYQNVIEPYCDAEPSDHTPFEPVLTSYPIGDDVDDGVFRAVGCGFEVRTGPKDTDVRAFGAELHEASRHFGEAYARWKTLLHEQEDNDEIAGYRQPMQPVFTDERGHDRFRMNSIVDYLLLNAGIDLNRLAMQPFPREDQMQFAQLIGYSLSGYSELSYVTDESYEAACKLAKRGES